jgi:hypothetical protein
MEMFDVKLEALMLTKAFDELNFKEREYVLEHLTELAYTNYHFILKNSIDTFSYDEKDFIPNPNIPEKLEESFRAKFLPAKKTLFLNISPSPTLFSSVAAVAVVAITIGFLMVNKPINKLNTPTSQTENIQAIPIEIEKKTNNVQLSLPLLSHVNIKKNIRIGKIKKQNDPVVNKTPELLRIQLFEPLLCFDIDPQEQMPCLNDETLTN